VGTDNGMTLTKIERKPDQAIIACLSDWLKRAQRGEVTSLIVCGRSDSKTWDYAWRGIDNRLEAAGQCLAVANLVLHDGFMREE
jgi:hypothetical protein